MIENKQQSNLFTVDNNNREKVQDTNSNQDENGGLKIIEKAKSFYQYIVPVA